VGRVRLPKSERLLGALFLSMLIGNPSCSSPGSSSAGLVLTNSILFVALGGAAIRVTGSVDDRLIANEMVGSFWGPRNVDAYAAATTAGTTRR
jgi:hypothetical protein